MMIGLLGIIIAIGGMFSGSAVVGVLCGFIGLACFIKAFMQGMNG